MEVIAEYKPGERVDLRFHHGVEPAYAVQGASVHAPGKDAMMLPTGATVQNLRDVKHGGFKIVGDTSLKLLAVHVIDRGKSLYDYSK